MLNYKLIIEYHQKGNNNSQIANLCGCERKTVIRVIKRFYELEIPIEEFNEIPDKQLMWIMYPKKTLKKGEYLIPDYKWEEKQMIKHRASVRLCWRRYCKRATAQGLKAYTWKRFLILYNEYKKPPKAVDMDKVRQKLQDYNFLLKKWRNKESEGYKQMLRDKEEWLKSLHLDEDKILDKKDKKSP